jgi:hypothetical protein
MGSIAVVVFVADSHNPIVVGMDTDYIVVEEAEIAVE